MMRSEHPQNTDLLFIPGLRTRVLEISPIY
jgi:hypothetical protein